MNHKNDFNGQVYDVGTGQAHSLNDIKEYFDNVFDVTWDIQPPRLGDVKNSKADTSGLDSIGWRSQINLKTGLRRCVANVS